MVVTRVLLFCLIGWLAAGPAAAIDLAGNVERMQGSAIATGTTGFSRPLQEGSTILVGDRIATTANSRLRLRMNDGAVITLGGNSTMTVEVYNEDESVGSAVIGIAEGIFLAASGAIARLGPDRFTINTPVAVLGVRGTEVWGELLADSLAVTLFSDGGVVVITPLGSIELTQVENGVTVVVGEALPAPKQWSAEHLEYARSSVAFE